MAKKNKDTSFSIKSEKNYSFYGNITQGEIHLTSTVRGDDWDSEKLYTFSKEDTAYILSLMSIEEFRDFCAEKDVEGLDEFIKEHHLNPNIGIF